MNVGVFQRFTATDEQQEAWAEWLDGARAARISGDICYQGFLAGWHAAESARKSALNRADRLASLIIACADSEELSTHVATSFSEEAAAEIHRAAEHYRAARASNP